MMCEAGLEPRPQILVGSSVEVGAPHVQKTYEQASGQEISELRVILSRSDRPTALFAMNDLMALQAMRAATLVGLKIPADMSVVGFDDLEIVSHIDPPLTTVAQDPFQIGREAARVLLDCIAGRLPADPTILLPTHLVVRESTARPPVK